MDTPPSLLFLEAFRYFSDSQAEKSAALRINFLRYALFFLLNEGKISSPLFLLERPLYVSLPTSRTAIPASPVELLFLSSSCRSSSPPPPFPPVSFG